MMKKLQILFVILIFYSCNKEQKSIKTENLSQECGTMLFDKEQIVYLVRCYDYLDKKSIYHLLGKGQSIKYDFLREVDILEIYYDFIFMENEDLVLNDSFRFESVYKGDTIYKYFSYDGKLIKGNPFVVLDTLYRDSIISIEGFISFPTNFMDSIIVKTYKSNNQAISSERKLTSRRIYMPFVNDKKSTWDIDFLCYMKNREVLSYKYQLDLKKFTP